MNLGIAALLYFGGGILASIALVYAYVAITGDEYGEKLLPLAKEGLTYPVGAPPYDPSKFGNRTNSTNSTMGGNYTLPNIKIPTSAQVNAAYYYKSLAAQEET
jgi:hypothetical protein